MAEMIHGRQATEEWSVEAVLGSYAKNQYWELSCYHPSRCAWIGTRRYFDGREEPVYRPDGPIFIPPVLV